jgi:hypothetical protein
MNRTALLGAGLLVTAAILFAELGGAFDAQLEHPAIGYATRPVNDPVSKLNRKLQEGGAQLQFEGVAGYLRSVLAALDVPIESQLVVFSKTSLQARLINPRNPRTIFFNDSVAVAWVRGEPFVEVAAEDPQQGVIFYTLEQQATNKPQFTRQEICLTCHESYSSMGVPGMLVRSVFPGSDGTPLRQLGDHLPDHRTPLAERWGGWYVTGKLGSLRHMGNWIISNPDETELRPSGASLDSLTGLFDTHAYLSPYSDAVAHLVFEHEMHMINLLTRVNWEVRFALYEHRRDLPDRLREAANELVDYLFFVDEPSLGGKIRGTSGFQEKFAERGPLDHAGRSLRQFDLNRRLMRYPCSFLIYAEAFDALPAEATEAIYKRMWQILSGAEKGEKYARLTAADRQAIIEILRETKHGLPDYFRVSER